MDKEEKEKIVDKLLLFILDDLEKKGLTHNCVHYNFLPMTSNSLVSERAEKKHSFSEFQNENTISGENMTIILNYCTTHGLLEQKTIGGRYSDLALTKKGYARTMSVEKAKTYQHTQPSTQNFNIGSINAHNMQMGNNNTQNIINFKSHILQEIDRANASPEAKEEAKTLLDDFLNNPIISGIVSNLPTSVIAGLLLGG